MLHFTLSPPLPHMNTTQYPLDQSTALFLSGILSAGHEDAADSLPPMDDGPRFPLPRHCLAGNVPRAPRNYTPPTADSDESPDIGEDEESDELENLLRSFARDKQGRDYSPDFLPSMRNRGAIRSELATMGCVWGE